VLHDNLEGEGESEGNDQRARAEYLKLNSTFKLDTTGRYLFYVCCFISVKHTYTLLLLSL
jgi:hypothetical protein